MNIEHDYNFRNFVLVYRLPFHPLRTHFRFVPQSSPQTGPFSHTNPCIYMHTKVFVPEGQRRNETINHSIGIQHSTLLPSNKNKLLMNHISRVISITENRCFECNVSLFQRSLFARLPLINRFHFTQKGNIFHLDSQRTLCC